MEGYDARTYGERIAGEYDDFFGAVFDVDATVDFLTELADGGPCLELAIGTGRIALPLAARGLDVRGIDASTAMVDRLKQKPGGDRIPVSIADFADVDVEGTFTVVFVVFNTFFALTTQDDQIRCFQNVAKHLTENGVFVIEAFVPDPTRFNQHQRMQVDSVDVDEAILEASRHDPVHQRVDSQRIVVSSGDIRMYPVRLRYAWPAELDLMARLAALQLRERWGGWRREPFDSRSTSHVSVYGR